MQAITPPGRTDQPSQEGSSKRRKVIAKVCENCRAKKAKCDSGRPQCASCRRKDAECIYREKAQPGLRPGFGKLLESRVECLEEQIGATNEKVTQMMATMQNDAPPHTVRNAQNQQASSAQEVLPLDDDWLPAAGTTARTFDPVDCTPGQTLATTALSHVHGQPVHDLPLEPVLQQLINLYLQKIHPWFPLLQKPPDPKVPEDEILLHGIVVTCFRYWTDLSPAKQQRDAYIKTSQDRITLSAVDSCDLKITQALALLAVDTLGFGTGPRAWNVLSMLVVAARHLNIAAKNGVSLVRNAQDEEEEVSVTAFEEESRRRLYWTIYMLDRFCSAQHGQAGGIQLKAGRVPYPGLDGEGEEVRGPFNPASACARPLTHMWHQYLDLMEFMNQANQLLIQPVDLNNAGACRDWKMQFRNLDTNLQSWCLTLLVQIRDTPAEFDAQWTLIHATKYLIQIRMYTVAAYPSRESQHIKSSNNAKSRCWDAINQIATLARPLVLDRESNHLEQLGPLFAFVLWVAARSLVILRTTGYEVSSNDDLEILLGALDQLSCQWPCAKRYSELVHMILDIGESPGGPQDIDAFFNTRNTAYGLEKRLNMLKARQLAGIAPHPFDFLDMPFAGLEEWSEMPPLGSDWL